MKKIISGLTVFILLAVFNYGIAQEPNLDFELGKLIVKSTQALNLQFFGNTGAPLTDSLNNYYGVSSIEQLFVSIGLDPQELALYNQIGLGRIYVLTLPDSTDILQAMEAYKSLSEVEYAEPNWNLTPLDVYPCDDQFQLGFQWGLWNNGSGFGWKARADIKAPEAWQIEKGDTNLIVGIIDSGILRNGDSLKQELRDRVWVNWAERNGQPGVDDDTNGYTDDSIGWNFVTNTPFVEPDNDHTYHGTKMAAIIGQETDSTNDCYEAAGINWRCKLMNLKVDYCVWRGDTCYVTLSSIAIIKAIYYAVAMEVDVLNLSFGRFFRKGALPAPWPTMQDALKFAYNSGVVSVAAMGNRVAVPDSAHFPAAFKEVLAVGATYQNDNRVTPFSYFTWESNYGYYIDLVAPGRYIITSYSETEGTSPATAIVSGIASLVITHRKKLIPSWSLTDSLGTKSIYEVLRHTADDTVGHTYQEGDTLYPEDILCFDQFYGWGRANAFKALVAVSHGDANNDSRIDAVDVTYLVSYLFKGGPQPVPVREMGDSNCDKRVTIADVVYLVSYLYKGGPPPSLCYTDCSKP